MSEMRRTRSLAVLPSYSSRDGSYGLSSYRPTSSSPSLYTLRRVLSLPELYPSYKWTPSTFRYSYREWDVWDDHWYGRRYYTSHRYWPRYMWPWRHYRSYLNYDYPWSNYTSYFRPSYYSGWWQDRPRYLARFHNDYFDTWYWRRRLDPDWHRPWSHYSWPYTRTWAHESGQLDRAWDMYRKGMISYDTMDKYYLSPSTWYNRYSDQLKPYQPPISYSSHPHYMYSSDYR